MPRNFTIASRRKKPPVPNETEWKAFPPAMYGKHWTRRKNPQYYRSHGSGYVCLLLTTDFCQHYVKRKSFLDHMRSVHHLNPGACPIGRPKSSTRIRKNPSEAASSSRAAHRRASESAQGSFGARVWKQKKERMTWLLRWASTLVDVIPKVVPNRWILKKARDRYAEWRLSSEFQETLYSVRENTRNFWLKLYPDMTIEEINKKAGIVEDLEGWVSDDGTPIVRMKMSDPSASKWVFEPRLVHEADTSDESEASEETEDSASEVESEVSEDSSEEEDSEESEDSGEEGSQANEASVTDSPSEVQPDEGESVAQGDGEGPSVEEYHGQSTQGEELRRVSNTVTARASSVQTGPLPPQSRRITRNSGSPAQLQAGARRLTRQSIRNSLTEIGHGTPEIRTAGVPNEGHENENVVEAATAEQRYSFFASPTYSDPPAPLQGETRRVTRQSIRNSLTHIRRGAPETVPASVPNVGHEDELVVEAATAEEADIFYASPTCTITTAQYLQIREEQRLRYIRLSKASNIATAADNSNEEELLQGHTEIPIHEGNRGISDRASEVAQMGHELFATSFNRASATSMLERVMNEGIQSDTQRNITQTPQEYVSMSLGTMGNQGEGSTVAVGGNPANNPTVILGLPAFGPDVVEQQMIPANTNSLGSVILLPWIETVDTNAAESVILLPWKETAIQAWVGEPSSPPQSE